MHLPPDRTGIIDLRAARAEARIARRAAELRLHRWRRLSEVALLMALIIACAALIILTFTRPDIRERTRRVGVPALTP